MIKNISKHKSVIQWSFRNFSCSAPNSFKVAVCGASGGIGAPLSLLLKMNPMVTELRMHDIVKHTPGVALDVAHIEYPAHVTPYVGAECLKAALQGADIVAIPAGVPRKPGMTRDDLFSSNAIVVKTIAENVAQQCPLAMVAIITNPVNTVVPIACEVMKSAGKLDPKRIFGITTLDNVRAATFVAQKMKISPKDVSIPVIGGHSADTIVPVFSRATPKINFPQEEIKSLTTLVGEAGSHVVKAKAGAGSATLSMAYSAARFLNSLMCAMKGESNILECTYIKTDICKSIEYFAGPVVLGKNGAERMCPIGNLSDFEMDLLSKAVPVLQKNIQKGKDYVKSSSSGGKSACASESKASDPCAGQTGAAGGGGGQDPCGGTSSSGGGVKC